MKGSRLVPDPPAGKPCHRRPAALTIATGIAGQGVCVHDSAPELWQFRLSMYPEKARWALDYKNIPHIRRSLLPGPHVPKLMPRFGQKALPILRDGARIIKGSAEVLAYLEQKHPEHPLLPADPALRVRALELQARFDEAGEHVRRAFFWEFLRDPGYAANLFASGQAPGTRRFYRLVFPGVRVVMRQQMKINAARAEESLGKTRELLDYVAGHQGPSGYLLGNRFSLADLAAAVMMQPCANPPEYPTPYPQPYPPDLGNWLKRWQNHPATAWTKEMYRRHRGKSVALEDRNS